jgi:hypothetical protein
MCTNSTIASVAAMLLPVANKNLNARENTAVTIKHFIVSVKRLLGYPVFICCLFNDAINGSDCKALNGGVICE